MILSESPSRIGIYGEVNIIDLYLIYYKIVLTGQKKISREREKQRGYIFSGIGHLSVIYNGDHIVGSLSPLCFINQWGHEMMLARTRRSWDKLLRHTGAEWTDVLDPATRGTQRLHRSSLFPMCPLLILSRVFQADFTRSSVSMRMRVWVVLRGFDCASSRPRFQGRLFVVWLDFQRTIVIFHSHRIKK